QAALFVQTVQERQGLQVGCPEEIAYRMGHIDAATLRPRADALGKTAYGTYLRDLAGGQLA
ncbi:glucose-1-phosphate thymidylyltransferase, partial [Roseomonas terrae]|nr:glucose-1-phosphate thymidylyltransferase [Neoroseomonas terrae]